MTYYIVYNNVSLNIYSIYITRYFFCKREQVQLILKRSMHKYSDIKLEPG